MRDPKRNSPILAGLSLAALTLAGCAAQPEHPAATPAVAPAANIDDYYQVEHEGRVYVFDDRAVFTDFLAHGETPYRKVRIGAGPDGRTLVFGLRDADKNKSSDIASIDLYDGRLEGGDPFYAEVWTEGRVYVFNRWDDLGAFRATGEANLRYTDIGAGPDGRTVVYVLNDQNKKARPDELIQSFRALHSL